MKKYSKEQIAEFEKRAVIRAQERKDLIVIKAMVSDSKITNPTRPTMSSSEYLKLYHAASTHEHCKTAINYYLNAKAWEDMKERQEDAKRRIESNSNPFSKFHRGISQ